MMPNLGLDPVRIVGCQPFQDVATAAASNNLLTANTLATQVSANQIQVCPDNLNGPLAAKANLYDKYIFRDLLFEYVSLVATSQAAGMAMSFSEDGLQTSGALSFATVRQVVPSVAFPFRTDRAYLHYHCAAPKLYYNLFNNSTAADSRLTVQGTFDAWPSITSVGAISQGFINVYYVCELYNPIPSSGFTLTVADKAARDIGRDLIREAQAGTLAHLRCLQRVVVGGGGDDDPSLDEPELGDLFESVIEFAGKERRRRCPTPVVTSVDVTRRGGSRP